MDTGRCQATNQAGKPCSAQVWQDGFCRWHHPDLAEERRAWSAKGGRRRSNRARAARELPDPVTAEELHAYLGAVFRGVIAGKVEPGVGTAAATIARALLDVARVCELEEQVGQMRQDIASFRKRAAGQGRDDAS